MVHPGKSTAMGRGVCGSALELHRGREGDHRGRPGPEPDWGNPTVRDRRGACGNVDHGGMRHPPRVSKERVLETLHLKLCAPQIYPDLLPEDRQENAEQDPQACIVPSFGMVSC